MAVECTGEEHQRGGGFSTLGVCILIVTFKGYCSLRFFLALLGVDAQREWEGAPLRVPRLILLSGRKKSGASSLPAPPRAQDSPKAFLGSPGRRATWHKLWTRSSWRTLAGLLRVRHQTAQIRRGPSISTSELAAPRSVQRVLRRAG